MKISKKNRNLFIRTLIAIAIVSLMPLTANAVLLSQLGILDLTANGGINPATGAPWAASNTYRLAFVSGVTRDAVSANIEDYNSFLQTAATDAELGGTWKVIGQTPDIDAKTNTSTGTGTGEAIFLIDGVTMIAENYSDLWDGSLDNFFNMTETGDTYSGAVATGSSRRFGDPAQTKIEYGDSSHKDDNHWWQIYNGLQTSQWHFYALSDPLIILDSADPNIMLIEMSPSDGQTNIPVPSVLIATFNHDVELLTGNITIVDLSDPNDPNDPSGLDIIIPVSDERVSVSEDLLIIDPGYSLAYSTPYAVLIDPNCISGFSGINDQTTWNFTTAEQNPLFSAIAALKDHITGVAVLTPEQIETHSLVIDAEKDSIDDNADVIWACFDLVDTFDTTPGFGPLWINTGSFGRDDPDNEGDINWAIFKVMQHIMDVVYTTENIAVYEDLLDGCKFACSARFPGPVDPPATIFTYTATINACYPDTAGWPRQGDELPARKPTGTYLAPGTIVTVTVPESLVNAGYQIRVGAHSWDFEANNRSPIKRLDRCTTLFDIDSTVMNVANPLGGGIYIEVPYLADAGIVEIDITGAVFSPYFSAKSFHATTLDEWLNVERHHLAPWADFQSEKFMVQVPTSWIYNMTDPVSYMADWDQAIDVFNDLMGFPRDRGKETIYEQVDVIMRSSVFAPGYPTVNSNDDNPTDDVHSGYANHYLARGPRIAPYWCFHEHGHAYFFNKIAGEKESTINLPHVPIFISFGYDLDYSFASSLGFEGNPHRTLDNTSVAWMTSFGFSPREIPMDYREKMYQLKGHAKFVEIGELFSWEVLNNYWKSFVDEYESTGVKPGDSDGYIDSDIVMLKISREADADIRPLFHFWGIHPLDPNTLEETIQTEGIKPSAKIYNRLLEYRELVPADNAEFRTFAFNWWGHQPSIYGYWTETEHARTSRFSAKRTLLTSNVPTVTITKQPGDPITITLTVEVSNVSRSSLAAQDTMTIEVFDDACAATGYVVSDSTDFNGNCFTDIKDFALFAAKWLIDYTIQAPGIITHND